MAHDRKKKKILQKKEKDLLFGVVRRCFFFRGKAFMWEKIMIIKMDAIAQWTKLGQISFRWCFSANGTVNGLWYNKQNSMMMF